MKLWRVISLISSVLLTILLVAFAIGLAGYAYLNEQLDSAGVKGWQLEIGQLAPNNIVINKLKLTLQAPEKDSTNESGADNSIGQLLSIQLPSFIPERIQINSLEIDGGLLSEDISATLLLNNGPEKLQLEVTTKQPLPIALTLTRINSQLQLAASYDGSHLDGVYDYNSGQLTADFEHQLSQLDLTEEAWLRETTVDGHYQGQLSPELTDFSLDRVVASLSGTMLIATAKPTAVEMANLSSTASASLNLRLNNGVINNYQFAVNGDMTNFGGVSVPQSNLKPTSLHWQLNSTDRLALPLMDLPQALTKTQWPAVLSANATGANQESIELSSTMSVQQQRGQFKALKLPRLQLTANNLELSVGSQPIHLNSLTSLLSGTFSDGHVTASTLEPISLNIDTFNNNFNAFLTLNRVATQLSNIDNTFADFNLKVTSNQLNLPNLKGFKASFDSQFNYQNNQLASTGELSLNEQIRFTHDSRITANQLTSRVVLPEINWQQTPLLSRLLKEISPEVVISSASISGQTDVSYNWQDSNWQLENGELSLSNSDWVAGTLSATNSNADIKFTAHSGSLDIPQANVHIGSLQQGFVVGPIDADFDLQVPIAAPVKSVLSLKQHQIKALGGSITIPNQQYSLAHTFSVPVVFERLSLGELMRQYPSNKISIDGEISGTLPVTWDSKQLTLNRGYFDALAPGGHLQVDSSALVSMAGSNPSLKTLAGVLSNFYYQDLSSVIDYDEQGKLTLAISLKGSNPAVENGRPVELNINLEEDLPALVKGLQLTNSLNDVIRKRIQQNIN
ncbi:MAG: YdbH domain-containing protein [Pseudomonadota bacterium]